MSTWWRISWQAEPTALELHAGSSFLSQGEDPREVDFGTEIPTEGLGEGRDEDWLEVLKYLRELREQVPSP